VLTNNPLLTPGDQQIRLRRMGIELPDGRIFTSAMATADFLAQQRPEGTAYAIGENGLMVALHEVGYRLTEHDPDYVVLGETISSGFEQITKAVRLISEGARFIATNPDVSGPTEHGLVPACGALAAMLQAATGVAPYFVGKPNPLMMREGLRRIGARAQDAAMVGDRMDTDIIAGTESGMGTILVLTGVTRREDVERFPSRPSLVVDSVADLEFD
jgi:NagD protein